MTDTMMTGAQNRLVQVVLTEIMADMFRLIRAMGISQLIAVIIGIVIIKCDIMQEFFLISQPAWIKTYTYRAGTDNYRANTDNYQANTDNYQANTDNYRNYAVI